MQKRCCHLNILPPVTGIGALSTQSYPEFSRFLALHHHPLLMPGQHVRYRFPHLSLIPITALG